MIEKLSVSHYLLQSKAIKLSPSTPFTWASGWKSPIYCDNRKTLAFSDIRTLICNRFVELIQKQFRDAEVIAGVATGAIAQGALVADRMELPFAYVRSAPKSHGLENLIEGQVSAGQKVVVVEDLISTGGSSLAAVDALRKAGCEVLGMVAIFTYGFPAAEKRFSEAGCRLFTLTDYTELLQLALQSNYIEAGQLPLLEQWREAPDRWMQEV